MAAQETNTVVVGIGASAGGLEALSKFIRHLDPKIKACFVVLQHLSPAHKSMMAEILSRETELPVLALQRATKPRTGTIYVVPANSNAIFKDGKIQLTPVTPEISPKPSINQFFKTLAEEMGDLAIGVVLSGTGSDGTAGLRAIQAEGGIAIVQKPESAKYAGMPQSAIDAGCADMVMTPAEIAQQMPEFVTLHLEPAESIHAQQLSRITDILSERKGMDFSGYKSGTMERRLKRRIVASGAGRMSDYLRLLNERPDEIDTLASEILISVTSFFRDKAAFESFNGALRQHLKQHPEKPELRIWVAGCATGEEAYSIAMLAAEAVNQLKDGIDVQIFATDLDDEALRVARRGVYSAGALVDVPAALIEKYFRPINNYYEVNKRIRDMVVFARHNLVSDPPFMRVDFITCRNVLIYFEAKLQRKVLERFHFALAEHGILFLGRSESITRAEELFSVSNRRDRLYSKSEGTTAPEAIAVKNDSSIELQAAQQLPVKAAEQGQYQVLQQLLVQLKGTLAICDRHQQILRVLGDSRKFYKSADWYQNKPVKQAILESLRPDLDILLKEFDWTGLKSSGQSHLLKGQYWQTWVLPLHDGDQLRLGVLTLPAFMQTAQAKLDAMKEAGTGHAQLLQDELFATREQLQSMLEELATSNEEMQSLNEETQASNEELQATNEELEAANEELQATNEELISLNQELNVKTAELIALNDEYMHVYDALEFPLLVFDVQGKLTRYNAQAQRVFHLRGNAIGRDFAKLQLPKYLRDEAQELFELAYTELDTQQRLVHGDDKVMQVTVTPGLNNAGDVYAVLFTAIDVTDITRAQAQLRASQHQLSQIMSNTTILLAMKDLNGNYSFANQSFRSAFGHSEKDIIGRSDFDLFPHEFATSIWEYDLKALRARKPMVHEHDFTDTAGTSRTFRVVHQPLTNEEGKAYALITEGEDITLRKKAEQQLQIAARVYEQAGEAIVVMDADARIHTVNAAFLKHSGLTEDEAQQSCFWQLLQLGREREDDGNLRESLEHEGFWQGEVNLQQKHGDYLAVWLTINRIHANDSNQASYVAVFADISNLKESQRRAEYLATHDSLTGLPNRTLFHDRLEHALSVARRTQTEVGLLFLDLDNFKTLNDTLGHDAGDELLIQAAERLKTVTRETDTVARLGGDEFTIIIADCTLAAAERVARQALEVLSQPFIIHRRRHFISGSIGIAFYPSDGADTTLLVKAADTAMYRAKENGRNRYEVFKEELQSQLVRHAGMENALRDALQNDKLYLEYQPKFDVADPTQIIGAEALLRWHDDELGQVSPAEFIAVAEQSNLIVDVDYYVAAALVSQLASWQKAGIAYPVMALNVSPKSFQSEGYVDLILRLLKQYNIKSLMIQIELTERTLVSQQQSELNNIERLREAGIQLSIDDFGTGYSSMSYLKRLPLAELKIDKTFVDGLAQEQNDEAISRAILAMAKALDIRTVAEGVETQAQLEWLQREGCDYAQGYYLARPMSPEAFLKRIKSA